MKLSCSVYTLRKRTTLNALQQEAVQEGVLIRLSEGEDWGVADICPKPEFGDRDWKSEIQEKGMLFLRATELAIEDLLARKNKRSLLTDRKISNNFLITDIFSEDLNHSDYQEKTLKIKCDARINELAVKLNVVRSDIKLRLDFNNVLNSEQFDRFLLSLHPDTIRKIEYIEDPVPFCERWKDWNQKVPLAYDFQQKPYREDWAAYQIIKPSRQSVSSVKPRLTYTSAMEHPVGFAHALRIAQKLAINESGFLTLNLYEPTEFHHYFITDKNLIGFSANALSDFGIGMTEELDKLQWIDV